MILSIFLEVLISRGILSRKDAAEIKTLFSLTSYLEGKSKLLFTEEEKVYANSVKSSIEGNRFAEIRRLAPPPSLLHMHGVIVDALPLIQKMKGI